MQVVIFLVTVQSDPQVRSDPCTNSSPLNLLPSSDRQLQQVTFSRSSLIHSGKNFLHKILFRDIYQVFKRVILCLLLIVQCVLSL